MNFLRTFKKKRQIFSYAFDYIIVIVCIGAFSALDLANPHRQQFALDDIYIQQPYAEEERVTAVQAGLVAVLAPIILMALWCFMFEGRVLLGAGAAGGDGSAVGTQRRKMTWAARLWELNMSVLGLLLSVGLALVTTNVVKNTVGRPRPDMLDRCRPVSNAASLVSPYGLSNSGICTQTDASTMRDGFKSFPSGHSSASFSGLGFLAIWLAGKLRTLDGAGHVWKVVVVTIPIMAATLIAASRIMDARHHPFDVLFGSALGIVSAWISYRQYFPAVRDGGVSYGPRTFGMDGEREEQYLPTTISTYEDHRHMYHEGGRGGNEYDMGTSRETDVADDSNHLSNSAAAAQVAWQTSRPTSGGQVV